MDIGLSFKNWGPELVPAVQHMDARQNRLAVKRGLQALAISFLTLVSAGIASAQSVTSTTVSPTTYTAAGQVLTFTVNMNSGNELVDNPSVASGIGVTYTCSPTSSTTTGVNISCSGTYTVQASNISTGSFVQEVGSATNNGNGYAPQAVVRANFVPPAQDQTINFTDPADIAIATLNQPVNLVATATSSLTVSFSSATGAVCSVSGATATVLTAGTCTINANQAGNGSFNPAPQVNQSFAISAMADTIPPVVTVPADISVNTDAGLATAAVPYSIGASDNVAVTSGPTRTAGLASGAAFPIGTTTVTYTAADAAGNIGTASFDVTVSDNENPVVTVPADIAVSTDAGLATAAVPYSVSASDNVAVTSGPTRTAGLASGAAFPIGTTTVTYTATDAAGNIGTASFDVTVADDEAPAFTSTQSNIVVEVDFDQTSAVVTFPTPTASDNTGTVSVAQTEGLPSGSNFSVGTTQVEFTATDDAGLTATLQFSVTVSNIPAGTVTFVVNSPDDGTVNFSSSEAALSVDVVVTGGSGSSGALQVVPGNYSATYSVPAGFALTSASCDSGSGSIDMASQVISMSFARGETYVCTLTALDIAAVTEEQIQSFIDNRARQIIANQPDRARRISRLTNRGNTNSVSVSGRNVGIEQPPFSLAVNGDAYDLSFSTSNFNHGSSISQPYWDVWFEASFSIYETGYGEGQFGIIHVGADYLIGPNALLGLGVQYDTLTEDVIGSSATTSGDGWMIGPYFTGRLSENLFFDATAKYGQSVNEISPLGTYTDEFSSERWLVSLALVGDFDFDAINIQPNLSLNYFEETTEAYTDSFAVPIASQATKLGDVELGSRFGWSSPTGSLSQHIAIDGIYTFEATGLSGAANSISTGLRGRVEYGGTVVTTSGGTWDYSLAYDGLGDPEYSAATASLGYSLNF